MTTAAGLDRPTRTASAGGLAVRVRSTRPLAGDIVHVEFAPASAEPLPSFTPGSHVIVECGEGRRNAYSLTGPEFAPDHYAISVRLDPGGHGGSAFVHALQVGDDVEISRPRSAFAPVLAAKHHVLVAGGIGITPILSHLRSAARWGRSVEVLYSHRPEAPAHAEEVRELCERAGGRFAECTSLAETSRVLRQVLSSSRIGTHVYVCGPLPMIEGLRQTAAELGWPDVRVHFEAFSAPEQEAGEPFVLTVSGSGERVEVPSGVSALEALEGAGHEVPNLCRQGVCGECRTAVAGGIPLHRDMVLTTEDKESGQWFMPCVSRCDGAELQVELS